MREQREQKLTQMQYESTKEVFMHKPSLWKNKRRNPYDAAFKLKAVNLSVKEGNRPAARTLGINESMVRCWRRQREQKLCKLLRV